MNFIWASPRFPAELPVAYQESSPRCPVEWVHRDSNGQVHQWQAGSAPVGLRRTPGIPVPQASVCACAATGASAYQGLSAPQMHTCRPTALLLTVLCATRSSSKPLYLCPAALEAPLRYNNPCSYSRWHHRHCESPCFYA